MLGVSSANKLSGPRQWDFLRPTAAHRLLDGVKREFIPSPAYYIHVRPAAASVLLKHTEKLAGRYDGVPKLTDDPGLVVNKLGKGTAVYMSGDLGSSIDSFHTPELMQLIANAGTQLGASPVTVENLPGTVEVVVRSQNGGRRKLIHLVNFTGEMTRPIRHVLPVQNARITLRFNASKARALWSGKDLPLTRDAAGRISITVPRVDEYEVVAVE